MNIMAKSPTLGESQYHGMYHRLWGLKTMTIGWSWYTTWRDWLNYVHKYKCTLCYWDSSCSVICPIIFIVLGCNPVWYYDTELNIELTFIAQKIQWLYIKINIKIKICLHLKTKLSTHITKTHYVVKPLFKNVHFNH